MLYLLLKWLHVLAEVFPLIRRAQRLLYDQSHFGRVFKRVTG
jgi:hypothetical protein